MRSRIIPLIALILFVAACGDDDGGATTTTTTSVAATTTTVTGSTVTSTTLGTTTTGAPAETTTTAGGLVPSGDPDIDSIASIYALVFDSSEPFELVARFIDDPAGLESTFAAYSSRGAQVGGASATATEVIVEGDTAQVVFTINFNGNPVFVGQEGDAVLTDEGWKISRAAFCGVMASARTNCPEG